MPVITLTPQIVCGTSDADHPHIRTPILDMNEAGRHWLRLPQRGFIDFVQYISHGVMDPYADPSDDIMNARPFSVSDKLRNAGRSIAMMIREGLITEAELTGFRWTEIGRCLAMAVVEGRASIHTNLSDPIPPAPGFWLDDLLYHLPDHVLAALVMLPSVSRVNSTPALADTMTIPVLQKVGVVAMRRTTPAIDWAVPKEAVLEFFRRNPARIPGPHEMELPEHMKTSDRAPLMEFLNDLRIARMEHDADNHDIWDIL
jgi:hypothetical protein